MESINQNLGLNQERLKVLEARLKNILQYEPRIGVFGASGAGKSSLCNALFGQDVCEINDVEACTREPQEIFLKIGQKGLKLIDVPGIGENKERDKEYKALYEKLLPELDLILWVLKADVRQYSSDEDVYFNHVAPLSNEKRPCFFVINQVDKLEPVREWDLQNHCPSEKQEINMNRKIERVAQEFKVPCSRVIAVSANEHFNLPQLVEEIIYALPKEKAVSFFHWTPKDMHTPAATEHVQKKWYEIVGEQIEKVVDKAVDVISEVGNTLADTTERITYALKDFLSWLPF